MYTCMAPNPFILGQHLYITQLNRQIFQFSEHRMLNWAEESWAAYTVALLCHNIHACRALVCPSPTSLSLSRHLSPPPDCGRQASRADGILASRMTLVFLPLVLILQSWLSKPNPTLARAAGSLPALLLRTQRLFIPARAWTSSSAYTFYLCATTELLSSIRFFPSTLSIAHQFDLFIEIFGFNNKPFSILSKVGSVCFIMSRQTIPDSSLFSSRTG